MQRWSHRQLVNLLQEVTQYAKDNGLHVNQVVIQMEGPARVFLSDDGWDEREMYGKHYDGEPPVKEVHL